jgi:hypothetical protein
MVGVGVVLTAATLASAGAAAALIAPALEAGLAAASSIATSSAAAASMEAAGMATAGFSTLEAGRNVLNHGELAVLMNSNATAQDKEAARKELKADTGVAALVDLTLGAGGIGMLAARGGSALLDAGAAIGSALSAARKTEAVTDEIVDIFESTGPSRQFWDIHISENPILEDLHDVDPSIARYRGRAWRSDSKPIGFWASNGKDWLMEGNHGYAYFVDTSKTKILEIDTKEKLEELIRRFGYKYKYDRISKAPPNPANPDDVFSFQNFRFDNFENTLDPEAKKQIDLEAAEDLLETAKDLGMGAEELPAWRLIQKWENSANNFMQETRINWQKVAENFDGIRFSPVNIMNQPGSKLYIPHWFRSLDINSSVIWNASKLKLTPLGKSSALYRADFLEDLKAMVGKSSEGDSSAQ